MSEHECTGNCSWYGLPHVHADVQITPTLTMLPAEPKPPSRSEMEEAIVAWGRRWDHVLSVLRDPTDIALWGLANRLEAFPLNPDAAQKRADEGPQRNWIWVATDEFSEPCADAGCEATDATHYHRPCDARGVDSGAAIPEVAPIAVSSDQGPLACDAPLVAALRRWVVAMDVVDAEGSGLAECQDYVDAGQALSALARSVLGVGE